MITFGQYLRSLRESRKVSLREFAKYMRWSAAYQSDIELSRRGAVSYDNIVKIMDYLELTELEYYTLLALRKIEKIDKVVCEYRKVMEQ